MEEGKVPAVQWTLTTGKTVVFVEPKISDMDNAAKVGGTDSANNFSIGMGLQKELLKKCLVAVDGRTLSLVEKEALDNLLTIKEYFQCMKIISEYLSDSGAENLEKKVVMV